MEKTTFAMVIGAEKSGIKWGRTTLFFAAYFLMDIFNLLLYPVVRQLITPEQNQSFGWVASAPNWIQVLCFDFALVAAFLVLFRWLKYELLALAAAVLVGIPIRLLTFLILFVLPDMISGNGLLKSQIPWLRFISIGFFDTLSIVGAIMITLLFIRRVWLALLIAAIFNMIVLRLHSISTSLLSGEVIKFDQILVLVITGLAGSLIFALFYGFLWWMYIDKETKGTKPRVSKEFYAASWIAANTTAITLAIICIAGILTADWIKYDLIYLSILMFIAFLISIYGGIIFLVLIYRMWAAIEDGYARMTPGEAVGFLFIPIYGIYWAFQVLPGFARDYNDYIDRHRINVPHLSSGLFTAYFLLTIFTAILPIGILPIMFVVPALISRICNAINVLPEDIPDAI